ncbi:tyrosine-type recombinase/integrase [Desulfovibrio aerotolerans]|uniref:Tyrosine-type recombinase/integrase n=1 Tax=Solidesulfovibrio aerotolerans TaxID=295255 RepID=A0A7C9MHR3_9BACT|nr:site-specific integrase [Solidesulfovibrio aerotolerans]MYL85270.1 tyrosine-type recombinase/integrase [Solidesulfovibrio aerotolerans]
MPTLDKRSKTPRWKGVVQVHGHRQEQRFPDDTQKSYRAAVQWEEEARKQLKNQQNQTDTVCNVVEWLTNYLDYSKESQSSKTYEEKQASCKRFATFIGKSAFTDEIDTVQVMSFLRGQFKKRSGYATNRDRKNLSAAWAWGRKYVQGFPKKDNPFQDVDRFPEIRSPRYVPTEEDFWKVYNLAEGQDKVMLLSFLHLGARKGEVFRMKVSDLELENGSINIWTSKRENGNKECDVLPLTTELKDTLNEWLKLRHVNSEYVFVNLSDTEFAVKYWGEPFKYRQHFMEKICKRAGVKPFGFHAIRHLTATILFRAGQPLSVIQAILRHKSPTTTARYLHGLGLGQTREALSSVMDGRRSQQTFKSI